MNKFNYFLFSFLYITLSALYLNASSLEHNEPSKKIIYLNNDMSIPFWQIMAKGIKSELKDSAYTFEVYDAKNSAKKELQLTVKAIQEKVAGIIVSPSNSSACVTILNMANQANIPVVISDVGSDSKNYLSYISSDNETGAYHIGQILTKKMTEKNWQSGKVGIIAISQKRLNGQQRTTGFMKALKESNIKSAAIKQLKTWTQEETYTYVKDMVNTFPDLRAIWLQTSSIYKGALQALEDLGKEKEILLIAFDAEPEFLELIPQNRIIASGMQQPYLMGKVASSTMLSHLKGQEVKKNKQVPILIVTTQNIQKKRPIIDLNVLGVE